MRKAVDDFKLFSNPAHLTTFKSCKFSNTTKDGNIFFSVKLANIPYFEERVAPQIFPYI
jgi:hypothetical protein